MLPVLTRDVQSMRAALAQGLQGLSVQEVEAAVAGVLQPYEDMVRGAVDRLVWLVCLTGSFDRLL